MTIEEKCNCGSNAFKILTEVEGNYGSEKTICVNCGDLHAESVLDVEVLIDRGLLKA